LNLKSIAIVWAQYGPYHFARVAALRQQAGKITIVALELANRTGDYAWRRGAGADGMITICPDSVYEELTFTTVFLRTRRELARRGIDVCLLPSYSPKQCLAALLAAKSLGVRTVMMNDSHAGTARSGRLGTWVKRWLVATFAAALVAGQPQKRYFSSLGLPKEKIITGYDAVDNDYFAAKTEEVRNRAPESRTQYDLPEHYFLNLGRFVAKKNLDTLIRAYALFLDTSQRRETHLVLVGSGEEESKLRKLCDELRLPKYDHPPGCLAKSTGEAPGVHFYGFRQIEENPVFYGLADAFILPSLYEEWGLVVNEAMACGLPAIVSKTAGCAEDLLEIGVPSDSRNGDAAAIQKFRLGSQVRKNGFVIDPKSPGELSRVMLCLAESPGLRMVMGGQSRRIVEKFSCQNFAKNAIEAARLATQ